MNSLRKHGRAFVLPYNFIVSLMSDFFYHNNINLDIPALDFGSGTLFFSELLSQKFDCKICAYDTIYKTNPPLITNSKIKIIHNFNSYSNYSFIFCCDVLHHLMKNELSSLLDNFTQLSNFIIIKDINADDKFGNLQNKLHDLIINRQKVNNIYPQKIIEFLNNKNFETKFFSLKKMGYPHFLILANKKQFIETKNN